MEFYTTGLPLAIEMFVKRDGNTILTKILDESIKVEKDMISLKGNLGEK